MNIPNASWRGGLWLVFLTAWVCMAAPSPSPPPAKYLFLVEVSDVTAPLSERVALVVADLIERGCGGRMQTGDFFTILPFHERLDPVGYTRKSWDGARSRHISNLAFLYLQKYKFDKKPRMDLVMAAVQQAIREERDLNVYLVVSGTQPILGTPFDADINAVLREHGESWRLHRGITVIALVAERGRLVDWAVGAAEPPAPTRLVARMPAPPTPPVPPPAPPPTSQVAQPTPQPKPAPQKEPTVKPVPAVQTNIIAQTTPPPPPPPVVSPPPAETVKPAEPTAKPLPSPSPTVVVTQVVVQPSPPPTPPPPQPQPPPVVEVPSKPSAASASTATVAVVNVVQTAPTQTSKPDEAVAKTSSASPSPEVQPSTVVTNSTAALEKPSAETASPTNAPTPPAPTVAVLPQPSPTPYGLLAAGAGLLGLAVWLVVLWHRRTRPAAAPSLITQSMERERRRTPTPPEKES